MGCGSAVDNDGEVDMLDQYQSLYENYRWLVPELMNAADMCCRRWANDPNRVALYFELPDRSLATITYANLQESINRLSNGLRRLGVSRGDRVVIGLFSPAKLITAHFAVCQLGAIAVPVDNASDKSLSERLRCLLPRVFILDEAHRQAYASDPRSKIHSSPVIATDFQDERALSWNSLLARQTAVFEPVNTSANAPMLLDVHQQQNFMNARVVSQQALLGALPGFVASQNWAPQQNDIVWIGADWSSIDIWLTMVLPSLYFGLTLLVSGSDMPADQLLARLDRQAVTNIYGSASVLTHLAQATTTRISRHPSLRAIASPPLSRALQQRLESLLAVKVNTLSGFSIAHAIVGDSSQRWAQQTGSIGRVMPGHQLIVLDADHRVLPSGTVGEIGVCLKDRHGNLDPAVLTHRWQEWIVRERMMLPTEAFMMTGYRGYFDESGFLWPHDEACIT